MENRLSMNIPRNQTCQEQGKFRVQRKRETKILPLVLPASEGNLGHSHQRARRVFPSLLTVNYSRAGDGVDRGIPRLRGRPESFETRGLLRLSARLNDSGMHFGSIVTSKKKTAGFVNPPR